MPKTFSQQKKFPVIYVFDRQNNRIFRQTYEVINYLVSFDEVPESIIIGISSENNQKRFQETSLAASSQQAKGEAMEHFLFDELIPWTEQNYNCGKVRTIIGHSRFGYYSSYLLARNTDSVSAVISLSPFYIQENVNIVDTLNHYLSTTQLNHNVYYRFITGDSVSDSKDYQLMLASLQHQKSNTKFNWQGYSFYNVQHLAVPGVALPIALADVFDYWSGMVNSFQKSKEPFTLKKYLAFKNHMHAHYGDSLSMGISSLNGLGYRYYNEERFDEARIVWSLLLEEYPLFTYAYVSIAKSYLKQNKMPDAQRYLEMANQRLSSSSFYTTKEKDEIRVEIKNLKQ